ncbi:MAG: flagellar hook-length control protein FliK [Hyphomonadaceae bacterium]|nr:flagellar hook-length control protein FliK [Hyphomonadaceae bacterium]
MINTGAVSQSPSAAIEATGERARGAQRSDGEEERAFQGLLSKLAGSGEEADGPAASVQESGGGQVADWLRGLAEAAVEGGGATDLEQALAERDGEGGGLTDIDLKALMQILGANGALAGAGGLAALAGRVANGTATEVETAQIEAALAAQGDADTPSPEELILASLAKAAGRTGEPTDGDGKATPVTLTVLGRETHLAPVADTSAEWAARLAAEGNRALRTGQPGSADAQRLQLATEMEQGGEVPLANPQVAVTAARDGQLGTGTNAGAPRGEPQAGAEARLETTSLAGRSDAPANAGPALSVTQQIADRVAGAASALSGQAARPEAALAAKPFGGPVKVLNIQLQPADLGAVTIRMAVKDNALRLDLEVGSGDTASLIQRERETLSALLRSAGYLIDGVNVRIADPGGVTAQNATGQAGMQMQGGGQSDSSQAEARSSGGRHQDGRQNHTFGNGSNGEDEQAGRSARRGGVYL